MNNVTLMGRLVKDPELKRTGSGVSVTAFTLAVNRAYVKKGEERQADFIDCVAWRGTADFICRNFKKGQMVALSGEIQTRSYETRDGDKRKATEIVVDNVYFCGDGQREARKAPDIYPEDSVEALDDEEEVITDDDFPF